MENGKPKPSCREKSLGTGFNELKHKERETEYIPGNVRLNNK